MLVCLFDMGQVLSQGRGRGNGTIGESVKVNLLSTSGGGFVQADQYQGPNLLMATS